MATNPGHEYIEAEKRYLQAITINEKISCLNEMIRTCPKHKSSEKMFAELKKRLAKKRKTNKKRFRKININKKRRISTNCNSRYNKLWEINIIIPFNKPKTKDISPPFYNKKTPNWNNGL